MVSSMMSSNPPAGEIVLHSHPMHSSSMSAGDNGHLVPSMMYCEYKADSFAFIIDFYWLYLCAIDDKVCKNKYFCADNKRF